MRILHLSHRTGLPAGGIELYVERVCREQSRTHQVATLAPRNARHGSADTGTGVTALRVRFEAPRNFEETYRDSRSRSHVLTAMREFDPDIVHIHQLDGLGLGVLDQEILGNARVLMTLHDFWFECANGSQRWHPELGLCPVLEPQRCADCTAARTALPQWVRRRWLQSGDTRAGMAYSDHSSAGVAGRKLGSLLRGLYRSGTIGQRSRIHRRWAAVRSRLHSIDRFIAPSSFIREEFHGFGIPGEKISLLPNGLDLDRFSRREDLPDRARRFAYIGSILPHKGVHVLVEAFSKAPPDCELEIVGDLSVHPSYVQNLKRKADPKRVTFREAVAPEHLPAILRRTDCVVVPSLWYENHPTVILESFASGVPVIASEIGGQAELLEHGGGISLRPGDPIALGRCIRKLSTHTGLLRQIAERIPAVPSVAEHCKKLDNLYGGVPAREAGPRA